MEREILYRGKSKETGKWVYGMYLVSNECHHIPNLHVIYSNDGTMFDYMGLKGCNVMPETVGQFTGREIKGQKLFEGDFFKVGNTLKVVKFFNMAFCICNVSDLENEHTIKVMGNSIYQYPDENWWKMFEDETYIIGNIHE